MTYYLGIDPGQHGAVAILKDGKLVAVTDLPHLGREVDIDALCDWYWDATVEEERGSTVLALERQQVMGSMPIGAPSAFAIGMGYGMLVGWARAQRYALYQVPPASWKRALGLSKDKDASRVMARSLYPEATPHLLRVKDDGRAEAILLAHWAMTKGDKR